MPRCARRSTSKAPVGGVSELEDRLRERDTADAEADLAGVKESLLKAQARINLAG